MFFGRGDRTLFSEEALPHAPSLYRAALFATRDPALAQDLVQETFKEAWSSFHRYRPHTNCKAWLFRIFFRVRGKYFRQLERLPDVPLEDVPEDRLAVEANQPRAEAEAVLRMLRTLPRHYQTILILSDAEDLSYREIAKVLDIPIGTVMSRLNRARALLRRKLESSDNTAPPLKLKRGGYNR